MPFRNLSETQIVDWLLPVWRRILRRADVSVRDNFFDLDGDIPEALALRSEVESGLGMQLPLLQLCATPTIETLSAWLAKSAPFSAADSYLLRTGAPGPPLFFVHGIGGCAFEFMRLARRVDSPRPMFATQARGTDGSAPALNRIEDMADFHLATIRSIQPNGPYRLIGFSLGGLVTYEMARKLTAQGERIASLILIEAYPAIHLVSAQQRRQVKFRTATQHLRNLTRLSPPNALGYLLSSSKRRSLAKQLEGAEAFLEPEISLYAPGMHTVADAAFEALQNYVPLPYSGSVAFIKAASNTRFPSNPRAFWEPLVHKYAETVVAGNHLSVLFVHFDELAAVVSRYLRSAEEVAQ